MEVIVRFIKHVANKQIWNKCKIQPIYLYIHISRNINIKCITALYEEKFSRIFGNCELISMALEKLFK